jgi:hypothetical protein
MTAAVFVVSFLAAFAAAGSVFGLGGFLGLGVGMAVGLAGAGVSAALAVQGTKGSTSKVTALLDIALSEDAPGDPPVAFRAEPWATLYREVASSRVSQRASSMALLELERMRRASEGSPVLPETYEPRPAHEAEELVGGTINTAAHADARRDAEQRIAETLRPYGAELASLEADLGAVLEALRPVPGTNGNGGNGTPAAMVDALVRTAADGIEDLAAGLMRANELAGVAERVTNRATLLALNAALEATRSGSEAFASIAEETRRLAEYAREATDTISRLSSEIEFKVGETIASIMSSSEDAKAAVASIGADGSSAPPETLPETRAAVESLLDRARVLRERLESSVAVIDEAEVPGYPVAVIDEAEVPAYQVVVDADAMADETGDDADRPYDAFEDLTTSDQADYAEPRAVDPGSMPPPESEGRGASAPSIESDADGDAVANADAPPAPRVDPKIPDWLEGLQPGGPR